MELDVLTDLYAIQRLKSRYFRFLDVKAWDLWRPLFTDDLGFSFEASALPNEATPLQRGGDHFVELTSRALQTAVTVHHGHMPDIEVLGPDDATGVWAMWDWVDDAEKGYAFQGWGHYHEKYRRDDGGHWRISELRLTRLRRDTIEPSRPGGERPWPTPWTP